tara:strand:+ start:6331 stop:7215 length:885 start_codon:yes stop_codon:yes gene_type:complete
MFESIDIGIVTYNRKNVLEETLSKILNGDISSINKIHIIDNNSTDSTGSSPILNHSKINYVKLKENIGSAGGFARCMKELLKTKADWIWLFNDDSYPMFGAVESLNLAREKLKNKKVGMVKVSREVEGKAEILFWNGVRKTKFIPISNKILESDLVTFDGSLISKKMIKDMGTCNPDYFMGTYEFDFCLRAKDKNYKIYTLPNGTIFDLKLGSAGGSPPWRTYYNTRNHLNLVLKRKSLKGVFQWIIRESKYTYGIIFFKDKKIKRLSLKFLASYHGAFGLLGKTISPTDSRWI